MNGRETISRSSTIAKVWNELSTGWPGTCLVWPRSASRFVTSWNALRPLSVNRKVTIGWFVVGSGSSRGSLMSVPRNSGLSFRTKKRSNGRSSGKLSGFSARTTIVPGGTVRISYPFGTRPSNSVSRSLRDESGPAASCLFGLKR